MGLVPTGGVRAFLLFVLLGCAPTQVAFAQSPELIEAQDQFLALEREGRLAEAEPFARRAVDLAARDFGSNHPYTASLLNTLGWLYVALGRNEGAIPVLQRALAIFEQSPDGFEVEIVEASNALAEIFYAQGRYAEALPLFETVLGSLEREIGAGHPDLAGMMNQIAALHLVVGNDAEADALLARSLAITEQAYGEDHPALADALVFRGGLHGRRGRYADAERDFERAISIYERTTGAESDRVVMALNNWARLYLDQGDHSRAELPLRRAMAILENKEAPGGLEQGWTAYALGNVVNARGNDAEAIRLYRLAIAGWEPVLGPDHPQLSDPLISLSTLYWTIGQNEDARDAYQRAMSIEQQPVALLLKNIGAAEEDPARKTEAELWRRLIQAERSTGHHPDVARALNALAEHYVALNRHDEAEPLLLGAGAILLAVYGTDHPDQAVVQHNFATLHADLGNDAIAESFYARAVAIRERVLAADDPAIAESLRALADLYVRVGRPSEAIPLYEQALGILEQRLPTDHPEVDAVRSALERLG